MPTLLPLTIDPSNQGCDGYISIYYFVWRRWWCVLLRENLHTLWFCCLFVCLFVFVMWWESITLFTLDYRLRVGALVGISKVLLIHPYSLFSAARPDDIYYVNNIAYGYWIYIYIYQYFSLEYSQEQKTSRRHFLFKNKIWDGSFYVAFWGCHFEGKKKKNAAPNGLGISSVQAQPLLYVLSSYHS